MGLRKDFGGEELLTGLFSVLLNREGNGILRSVIHCWVKNSLTLQVIQHPCYLPPHQIIVMLPRHFDNKDTPTTLPNASGTMVLTPLGNHSTVSLQWALFLSTFCYEKFQTDKLKEQYNKHLDTHQLDSEIVNILPNFLYLLYVCLFFFILPNHLKGSCQHDDTLYMHLLKLSMHLLKLRTDFVIITLLPHLRTQITKKFLISI